MSFSRPTIRDVADRAGVSVATISKVMNGRDGVAEDTRQRVRNVVDELGYVSRIGAQSLRAMRTGVIGVLVSGFEPYATEVLKGVAQGALHVPAVEIMAWSGTVGDAPPPTGWESRLLLRLGGSLIDGAIVIAPSLIDDPLLDLPLVMVDPHQGGERYPSVRVDDRDGARQAVDHLVGLGHRRIGYLGGRADLESARERRAGYREGMSAHGLSTDGLMTEGDYTWNGAVGPATRLLHLPERPTAIFASNDMSALCVIEIAHAMGLEVPRDLSVIGFDDIPDANRAAHPLTTVAQPLTEIGVQAIAMLSDLLRGRTPEHHHLRLEAHLRTRGTTAPPA